MSTIRLKIRIKHRHRAKRLSEDNTNYLSIISGYHRDNWIRVKVRLACLVVSSRVPEPIKLIYFRDEKLSELL